MHYAEMAERLGVVEHYFYQEVGLPTEATIQQGDKVVHTHRNSLSNHLTMTGYLDTLFPDAAGYPKSELMINFGDRPDVSLLSKKPTECRSISLDWGGDDTIDGRLGEEKDFLRFNNSIKVTAHYDTDGQIKRAELSVDETILGYRVPNGPIMVNPENPVLHYERGGEDSLVKTGYTPLEYPVKTGTLVFPEVIPIAKDTIQCIVEHVYERRHILEPAPFIDPAKISGVIFPGLALKQSVSIPPVIYYESIISFIEKLAKREQKLLA